MKLIPLMLCSLYLFSSCSSLTKENDDFCPKLNEFAEQMPQGKTRTLTFGRGGLWMVDHYTFCGGDVQDEATKSFCAWVAKNTSSEFMEANINRAISCLQSQKIKGYLGNTGIETWNGEIVFFSSNAVPNTKITLKYEVVPPASAGDNFMEFTLVKK